MKMFKLCLAVLAFGFLATGCKKDDDVAEPVTVTVATYANNGDIQLLDWYTGNGRNNQGLDIPLIRWTDGPEVGVRSVLRFDLSKIPANATVTSAKLYLYSYPANLINGNMVDANYGNNNAFYIQRISANYDPATVSWYSKPTTTTDGQVLVPHTSLSKLDLAVDVKALVQSMVSGNNYGFHMYLQDETVFTSRIFVSSHNTTFANLAPKLEVTYQ